MVAAIEIYNKPGFPYRAESFVILAINSWELLLKAKWLSENDNNVKNLYVYEKRGENKKKRIKLTRAGNPMTYNLSYLAKKLIENKKFDVQAWANIQILLEFRDSAIHFYNQSPAFRTRLQEIGAACVKNFDMAVRDWFDRGLSEFELHLMPLAFVDSSSNMEGLLFKAEEDKFINFFKSLDTPQPNSKSPYMIAVNIDLKFIRSNTKNAPGVRVTNDPNAPSVQITEEQVLDQYPWDYSRLTKECRKRYMDFKQDIRYHKIRKNLLKDVRFGKNRFLDPNNTKSAKKPFFNPNILQELDNYYTKTTKRRSK